MRKPSTRYVTRPSLIVEATKSQDAKAWDELVSYYQPFVTAILADMGFQESDLEDARQQVFIKLWNGLQKYKSEKGGFRPWFSRLIRNAAIDWLRVYRSKLETLSLDGPDIPEIGATAVEEKIEEEWRKYIVDLAMDRLRGVFSGKAFEVFALSLEGRAAQEIAEKFSLRLESVYVLKTRVKKRLQKEIQQLRHDLEFPDAG